MYRLAELRRISEQRLASVPILLLPTTPTLYRRDEVEADPIALNARLGLYTNFVNLLGLCAVTVPAGFRGDGLPFGASLIALPGNERLLAAIGSRLHAALGVGAGAMKRVFPAPFESTEPTRGCARVAVVVAHLSGLPLNAQLTSRGARLAERTRTAPCYRLYALAADGPVCRPGLVRVAAGEAGGSIEAEVWEMPGPLDLTTLCGLAALDLPELRDPPWHPPLPPALRDPEEPIFATLALGDLLVHHPYESFDGSVAARARVRSTTDCNR